MELINDKHCSWINDLNPRTNIKTLKSKEDCEWLIVGAGFYRSICSKKTWTTIS